VWDSYGVRVESKVVIRTQVLHPGAVHFKQPPMYALVGAEGVVAVRPEECRKLVIVPITPRNGSNPPTHRYLDSVLYNTGSCMLSFTHSFNQSINQLIIPSIHAAARNGNNASKAKQKRKELLQEVCNEVDPAAIT
jgi:hypothetical protein